MTILYKHKIAFIYILVLFIDRLDLTCINIVLPNLAIDLSVPISVTDKVSISFLIALSISILISNYLGDRYGNKKIFVGALFLSSLSSCFCACTNSFDLLVVFRATQGISVGLVLPVGITMLYRNYRKSEYASITSYTFLPTLIAPAIAPFLGGIFSDYLSWRAVFILSATLTLLTAICAMFFLKEDSHRIVKKFDGVGFVLSAILLINFFYTLSFITKNGMPHFAIISFISTCILLGTFVWWENKINYPLIDLSFFTHSMFFKANIIQLCFQICHFGFIFLVGIYLQMGVGMSATTAGIIMGMQAFGAMSSSRYSVKLFNKHGPTAPLMIGLAGIGIITPCIMFIHHKDMILLGAILFFARGVFSGLCGTPIQTLSVMDCSQEKLGQANSLFNIGRQISISLGIAASSILLSYSLSMNNLIGVEDINPTQSINIFFINFIFITVIAFIAILVSNNIRVKKYIEVKN